MSSVIPADHVRRGVPVSCRRSLLTMPGLAWHGLPLPTKGKWPTRMSSFLSLQACSVSHRRDLRRANRCSPESSACSSDADAAFDRFDADDAFVLGLVGKERVRRTSPMRKSRHVCFAGPSCRSCRLGLHGVFSRDFRCSATPTAEIHDDGPLGAAFAVVMAGNAVGSSCRAWSLSPR